MVNYKTAENIILNKLVALGNSGADDSELADAHTLLINVGRLELDIMEAFSDPIHSMTGYISVPAVNTSEEKFKIVRFVIEDYNFNHYPIEINNWDVGETKYITFNCHIDQDLIECGYDLQHFSLANDYLEFEFADSEKQALIERGVFGFEDNNKSANKTMSPTNEGQDIINERKCSADAIVVREEDRYTISVPEFGIKCEGLDDYEDTIKLAEYILAEVFMSNSHIKTKGSLNYSTINVDNGDKELTNAHIETNIYDYERMVKALANKVYYDYETEDEANVREKQSVNSNHNKQNSSGCLTAILVALAAMALLVLLIV